MRDGLVTTVLVLGAIALYVAITTRTAEARERSAHNLGRSVGLPVPPALLPTIAARSARRVRAAAVGATVGALTWALAGTLTETLLPGTASAGGAHLLLLSAVIAGAATGVAVAAVTDRTPVLGDRPRVARAQAPELRDYLAPSELQGTRITVAVGLTTAAVGLWVLGTDRIELVGPADARVAVTMAVLAVPALIGFEVIARWIMDRGRPAGSPLELAWDDAIRSSQLRDVVTLPLCLATSATIVMVLELVEGAVLGPAPIVSSGVGLIAAGLAVVLALVAGIATIASKPRQHYLRRLWPELVGGGVVEEDPVEAGR